MLAQALNQQDRSAAAQLRETLRCLSLFDQVKVLKNKHRVFNFTISPGWLYKTGAKLVGGIQKKISIHCLPGEEQAGAALLLGRLRESCCEA